MMIDSNSDNSSPAVMQPVISRALRILTSFVNWQPLTMRGLAVLVLSLYALRIWAIPEADLVAAVLGGGLLALCVLMFVLSLMVRVRLGQRLQGEALFDSDNPLSRCEVAAGIVLLHSSIPSYFALCVARRFAQDTVVSNVHVVKGQEPELGRRHLIDSVVWPHRGLWTLAALEFSLQDALGFTKLNWSLPIGVSVEVSAPTVSIKPLPILAASSRIGDQWNQSRERTGDMFDIKAYDSSDGIKRILWKTFAKSGELVVRRPEPAIIPEGEVALYLIARKEEDHVAGAAQDYINELHRNQITVLFGTDGMLSSVVGSEQLANSAPSSTSSSSSSPFSSLSSSVKILSTAPQCFVSTDETIRKAINYSVWSSQAGTGEGFEAYLESLSSSNRVVHNVVVFVGSSKSGITADKRSSDDWFKRISAVAAIHFVKLSIALVPENMAASLLSRMEMRKSHSVPLHKLAFWRKETGGHEVQELAMTIQRSGAEVIEVESRE
jgi:hypothetical protein